VITFKFRETPEFKKRAILSQILFYLLSKERFINRKRDRYRDSMEAVLANGGTVKGIFPPKRQKGSRINLSIEYYNK
jgi:hypothetical protein